jgi:hypothetical protein
MNQENRQIQRLVVTSTMATTTTISVSTTIAVTITITIRMSVRTESCISEDRS